MNPPIIEFKNVTKRFGRRTILDRVDLQIPEGDVTTIIGKSGEGKSVLLKHIIGLLKPEEGSVLFRGEPIEKMSRKKWNAYLSQVSYMFQNNALFDSKTVYENVALPLRKFNHLTKKQIHARVMARIEQTELTEVAHRYPSELSGGMQKRVALARALVTDPKMVLFDELTTGQDPIRRNAILGMIAEYKKQYGFTAVLISHDIPDVFFISDHILALYGKKIVFQGAPEAFEEFDHPFCDEIVNSIESLQDELTGLHSRRQFKVRYQTALARHNGQRHFIVVLFTLEDMDRIIDNLGHTAAQVSIRTMGDYINKHFGQVGGFSARRRINQFSTVLPFSDLDEAQAIMANFTRDFRENGLNRIENAARQVNPAVRCFEFMVTAGMARGGGNVELDSIMEFADFKKEPVAQFQCNI
ncbi:MAG: ATP-binding cassette domain-containing protein [Deltaproteobacteria bacterium]|jgi:phospholipid/cholesterol/gamma-HCH transport system ATP-binding protein|nr:ATP-binding cassette domain-containing protein [Deltaproteobacteria bacterium]